MGGTGPAHRGVRRRPKARAILILGPAGPGGPNPASPRIGGSRVPWRVRRRRKLDAREHHDDREKPSKVGYPADVTCVGLASDGRRIGNIAMLGRLREAVAAPGRAPTILGLISSAGCGELIGEGEVRRLLGEARGLLADPPTDPEVRTLCTTRIEPGEASLREGNPIEVG